jgi:hypothetical protein
MIVSCGSPNALPPKYEKEDASGDSEDKSDDGEIPDGCIVMNQSLLDSSRTVDQKAVV